MKSNFPKQSVAAAESIHSEPEHSFASNLKLLLEIILIGYVNIGSSVPEPKYPQNPQVFPTRPHPDFVILAVHVSEFSLFVILDEARYCDLGGLTHFPALEVLESLLASLK